MTGQTTIERRTLSDQVAERLERDIREGRYAAGDRLPPERALMAEFGVGRPAVREALFYLQKIGFVAIANGARARVIRPGLDDVALRLASALRGTLDDQTALQAARVMFEVALAREAAARATPADVAALETALEANRRTLGDERGFKRSDVAFHAALAAVAANPVVAAAHDALATLLDDRRAEALQRPGEDAAALGAHRAIAAAVAARDPDAAEAAMRRHLAHHYGSFRRLREGQGR